MRRRWTGHGHGDREAELRDVSGEDLRRLLVEEERLLLVAFWTPGCEPCRELRRGLNGLGGGVAEVVAVNADNELEAVREHRVDDFPTLLFCKNGRELHRLKGGALPASTLQLLPPA